MSSMPRVGNTSSTAAAIKSARCVHRRGPPANPLMSVRVTFLDGLPGRVKRFFRTQNTSTAKTPRAPRAGNQATRQLGNQGFQVA